MRTSSVGWKLLRGKRRPVGRGGRRCKPCSPQPPGDEADRARSDRGRGKNGLGGSVMRSLALCRLTEERLQSRKLFPGPPRLVSHVAYTQHEAWKLRALPIDPLHGGRA